MPKVWVDAPAGIENLFSACQNEKSIAVDTEFIREKTFFPQVALIQIASAHGVWLVDPLALSPDELRPLLDLLEDPKILKVMHAAYGDQECFFHEYKTVAAPVLDTAVAAALLGMGDNIGLGRLTKEILKHDLPKGRARAHWLDRPLSAELMEYASADVRYLVELGDYFAAALSAKNRLDWALEESEITAHDLDEAPELVATRIASGVNLDKLGQRILYHLVVWRENRARSRNLPRRWIAENEVLVSIARVKPQSLRDLKSFRGIPQVEKIGTELIETLERARQSDITFPKRAGGETPTQAEENVLTLLQSFIAFKASELSIAPRMLATSAQLLRVFRTAKGGCAAWAEERILRPRVIELLGQELESLLAGKSVLTIQDAKVSLISRATIKSSD